MGKNEFDEALEDALAGNVQITNIGYITDEKPKNKVWFTAQDRLFVLDFTESKRAIKQAVEKHIIGEDAEVVIDSRTFAPASIQSELHQVQNDLRVQQRSKLNLNNS